MCSFDRLVRVVPPPDRFFWTDEKTPVVTMSELTEELLLLQQESRCPAECSYCGTKKGQLPPFKFTFIDLEDTPPWANELVSTRCQITITKHVPSSICYQSHQYYITAYGYSQQDFWKSCLAPLMKRVKLSSLPNLSLDWSHVQVLELHGKTRTARSSSSSSGDTIVNTKHHQDLLTRSETELLRTILVSPTCQIFHLELCWCAMDTAGLFWDAVAQCPTLTILTLKDCDLSAETLSNARLPPMPATRISLLSSNNNHQDTSSTIQGIQSGHLQELKIEGCIVDENSLDGLACLLRNSATSLQHVAMINNDWPLDAGYKVASSFMSHTRLESLDFTGLHADDSAIQGIGQLLKTSSSLQKLNLSQFVQVMDVKPLADGLIGCKLIELDLSNNRLINLGTLAMALLENDDLYSLNLSKTTIHSDDSNSKTFLVHLGKARGLKVLALDEVELSAQPMKDLAQSLRINTSLDSLHLNNIGESVSWTSMFDALRDNKTLRTLQIGHNRFSEDDWKLLVAALCVNRSLRSLTLTRCDLTDDRLVALGERLPDMQGLENLDLNFNSFGTKGVMGLWQGLSTNYSLQGMSLFNSAWTVSGPLNFECNGYAKENELIQELVERNRDVTKPSQVDVNESTPHQPESSNE